MKVACWTDEHRGPAFVSSLEPGRGLIPETASVSRCPPGPRRQWAARGTAVTWRQWAFRLADRLPYGGQWSVQEVPDGLTVRQALAVLRRRALVSAYTGGAPGGPSTPPPPGASPPPPAG